MKHFSFLLVFLFTLTIAKTQTTDTAVSHIPKTWARPHFGVRAGFGIQKTFFTELGLSLQRYFYSEREGFMVTNLYTSFEWIPSVSGQAPVYGVKLGGELVNNGGAGGIEVKWLGNKDYNDVVITPKLGLGLGFVNIFYGYNFSTNKYPFPKIGKSQFSMVVNTNILFFNQK